MPLFWILFVIIFLILSTGITINDKTIITIHCVISNGQTFTRFPAKVQVRITPTKIPIAIFTNNLFLFKNNNNIKDNNIPIGTVIIFDIPTISDKLSPIEKKESKK